MSGQVDAQTALIREGFVKALHTYLGTLAQALEWALPWVTLVSLYTRRRLGKTASGSVALGAADPSNTSWGTTRRGAGDATRTAMPRDRTPHLGDGAVSVMEWQRKERRCRNYFRRTVVRGIAWMTPVIAVAAGVPAFARSPPTRDRSNASNAADGGRDHARSRRFHHQPSRVSRTCLDRRARRPGALT